MADDGRIIGLGQQVIYDPQLDIWPDLKKGRIVLKPVRIGVNRTTGKMLTGWDHVVQSMTVIFLTKYHTRVLRRWVGSFVPLILGENLIERTVTRFYWAIATAIDLWEPNFRLTRIRVAARDDDTQLTSDEEFRKGHLSTQNEGIYRPRAHLGDTTPERRRRAGLIRARGIWEKAG